MNDTSFVIYTNYLDVLSDLSNEDMGIIFRAILLYKKNGEIPELPIHLSIAFKFIKNQMDLDAQKYNEKCTKAKENGKLGGRPKKNQTVFKKPNGFFENHNDNDNDNVNVNDNDNVLKKEKEKKPKIDFSFNENVNRFKNEYKRIYGVYPYLDRMHIEKLEELLTLNPDFWDLLPTVLERLKKTSFRFKDRTFKPNVSWLLKESNFIALANDSFCDDKETDKLKHETEVWQQVEELLTRSG